MSDLLNNLTPKELIFVYEYIKDFKKAEAARRAGVAPGYSYEWSTRVLRKPEIQEAIAAALDARVEETKIDANWVLQRLAELYDADIAEIITYDARGEPRYDFTNASPRLLAAIESITVADTKYGSNIKVQLPSKHKLLETIGKHVGVNAFKEMIEHSGAVQVVFDEQDKDA